ncbi:MAG: hypothetical protein U9O98_07530 [Asgard group archaeon]|nr:hypothetical protein [Asgard group archaeon]
MPDFKLPEDYMIKHVQLPIDFKKYRAVQAAVFSHCKQMTLKKVKHYTQASFYQPDLN